MVQETELYLKLQVNSNATPKEIQDNYWSIVKTLQPAEVVDSQKLVEITEAYNILKDPVLRRKYDVEGIHSIRRMGITEDISWTSNLITKFNYFCYDVVSNFSQMSPSEKDPLISTERSKGPGPGCCFRTLVWFLVICLLLFFLAAITYQIFLED